MIKNSQSQFSLDFSADHYGNYVLASLAFLGYKKNIYIFIVFVIFPQMRSGNCPVQEVKKPNYKENQRQEVKKCNADSMVCALNPSIPKDFNYVARARGRKRNLFLLKLARFCHLDPKDSEKQA